MEKDDLYSGHYAAYILGYNDKLCDNEQQKKQSNENKKRRALVSLKKKKDVK